VYLASAAPMSKVFGIDVAFGAFDRRQTVWTVLRKRVHKALAAAIAAAVDDRCAGSMIDSDPIPVSALLGR